MCAVLQQVNVARTKGSFQRFKLLLNHKIRSIVAKRDYNARAGRRAAGAAGSLLWFRGPFGLAKERVRPHGWSNALQDSEIRRPKMATGWAGDGAVQDQIDATVKDGIQRAHSRTPGIAARRASGIVAAQFAQCVAPGP